MNRMITAGVASVYRRLPIWSGLSRLSYNRVLNPLFKRSPPDRWATLRDGIRINVRVNDFAGRVLYLFGTNDPKVAGVCTALASRIDVFLDIGANYSTIGLAVSRAMGGRGDVHLFEPQADISDRVQVAIDSGGYGNVTLHRLGLMDEDGTFELRSPSNHSGMASFSAADVSSRFDKVEVCTVKEIGAYTTPLVSGRRFGAKLDVEGSEPAVMPWLLAQPNLLFMVFEASRNQQLLFDESRKAGFSVFGLMRHPLKLRVVPITEFARMSDFHDILIVRLKADSPLQAEMHPSALLPLLDLD